MMSINKEKMEQQEAQNVIIDDEEEGKENSDSEEEGGRTSKPVGFTARQEAGNVTGSIHADIVSLRLNELEKLFAQS